MPWEARQIVNDVAAKVGQLQPLLNGISPQVWVDTKGAPSTYLIQWQSAQEQLRNVDTAFKLFGQNADSLHLGLDAYFRLESLEVAERALLDGVQRYDTREKADGLARYAGQLFASRQKLQSYLRNLAASTEETCRIADSEAQRCRANLSQQQNPAPSRRPRK